MATTDNEQGAGGTGPDTTQQGAGTDPTIAPAAVREPISDAQMAAITKTTAQIMREQPKVTIQLYQVPKGSTESKLPDETVVINGHTFLIKRGVSVSVPQSVADVLIQAGRL